MLLQHDVCLCAGERLGSDDVPGSHPQLTRLVKSPGCASKIPPLDLARVLSRLPPVTDPRVLVSADTADDAGVFRISPGLALVQTVDVMTPCVDDPYLFGRIAACNSVSDVYAMGGAPLTALSIISYSLQSLSDEWMYLMLKGGVDALAEAGVSLIGGHSINDEEIKFGFAVTGIIDPDAVITNAGAQPGDALILTKGIGTGIISFAAQIGRASEKSVQAAGASMAALNRDAAQVMREAGAHACTDVTGFGLLGHLAHLVRESGVTAELWWDAVPILPGVNDYAAAGIIPGAAERNREFAAAFTQLCDVPEWVADILCDAQTSGGLLMAVSEDSAEQTLAALHRAGCVEAATVGRTTKASKGEIVVMKRQSCGSSAADDAAAQTSKATEQPCGHAQASLPAQEAQSAEDRCCASEATGGASSAQEAFQRFMAAAFAPGALDVIQKELMTIALSVAVQCEPCLKLHLDKARSMGITAEEIEEAAWMGVAFGGCKAMMFWQERKPR